MTGRFNWLSKLGATDRAIAVLNSQPSLFATLVLVIAGLLAQIVLLAYIHRATRKLEAQAQAGPKQAAEGEGKPTATATATATEQSEGPGPSRPRTRASRL